MDAWDRAREEPDPTLRRSLPYRVKGMVGVGDEER